MNIRPTAQKPPDTLPTVCPWCLAERRVRAPPGVVSHGICPEHKELVPRGRWLRRPGERSS